MRQTLRTLLLLALAAMIASWWPASAAAAEEEVEVSTADLLNAWEEYDGRAVVFQGEAVGDVMRRGDFAWVMVNDDHYSRAGRLEAGELRGGNSGIGVWMPAAEAEKIRVLGRFGTIGDFVEVRGVFNADCREHGGDFDIHARSLEAIVPGRKLDASPEVGKYWAALFSLLFVLVTLAPFLRRRAREMRSARSLLRREEE